MLPGDLRFDGRKTADAGLKKVPARFEKNLSLDWSRALAFPAPAGNGAKAERRKASGTEDVLQSLFEKIQNLQNLQKLQKLLNKTL